MSITRDGRFGRRSVRWLAAACVVLAAGGLAGSARAAVSYSQQTLFSNLGYPVGVAVDASGDLFVADAGGGLGDGSLYELKPQTNGS